MKLAGVALVLVLAQAAAPDDTPRAEPRFFHYRAPVQLPAGAHGRLCAVLPASVFTHARPTLADLRLYRGAEEVPYVVTESKSSLLPPEPARVLNLGMQGSRISFDLQMPARSYTEVHLGLDGQNFLATAHVSGSARPGAPATDLGQYTLFDLSGQHLSRNTVLPLPESSFPNLHVDLAVAAAPGFSLTPAPAMVTGAEVPPDLEAQTLYTPVASTTAFAQRGRATFAALDLPAHVPAERVRFTLQPGAAVNFSRTVRLTATPIGTERDRNDSRPPEPERVTGEISRVSLPAQAPGTEPIRAESLTINATLGANLQRPASVEIAVENGDDRPVPLASVALEMRERKLCFDAPAAGGPLLLFYGDPAIAEPEYDYARLYNPAAPTAAARLGAETANPDYTPRPEPAKAFTERHPNLLWAALLAAVAALGFVALRQARPAVNKT